MPAPVARPRCRRGRPSPGQLGSGRPPSATAAPVAASSVPDSAASSSIACSIRASRSARVEHMLELYGVALSLSGDPADRQSVTDCIPGVIGRAGREGGRVGGRVRGCTRVSARPRSRSACRYGRASRSAAGAPARALTGSVRRQIPVWITSRHCGPSYRLRFFSYRRWTGYPAERLRRSERPFPQLYPHGWHSRGVVFAQFFHRPCTAVIGRPGGHAAKLS
jgi:hypothetical protein